MKLTVNSDGACRPSRGLMAIGATIQDENGVEIATVSKLIGYGTSNQAEYWALIEAAKIAIALGATEVQFWTDSELVAKHVSGDYKARDRALKALRAKLIGVLSLFQKYRVQHIRRENNTRADELANLAYIGNRSSDPEQPEAISNAVDLDEASVSGQRLKTALLRQIRSSTSRHEPPPPEGGAKKRRGRGKIQAGTLHGSAGPHSPETSV